MEATAAATMEAAAVEPTAMETAASIARHGSRQTRHGNSRHAGKPRHGSRTRHIHRRITAAIVAAAVIGSAVIPSRRRTERLTDPRVDAGLITTGKRDRERRKDCAQKNPTANHGFLSLAYLITPELTFRSPATDKPLRGLTILKPC